jgi:PAP2 superfamily
VPGQNRSHRRTLTVAAMLAFASALALARPVAYGSSPGSADSVITWDRNAQAAIWDVAGQQPRVQGRSFAMVHGAIYDAVNAIAGTPYQPYLVAPRAGRHAATDAAVATAAYQVLLALFPDQEPRLRAQYHDSLAAIPNGAGKQSGISAGRQADAAIVCFTEKATWSFWRPVTAVQLADTDGNPATVGDPAWMPLLITPPFPDYTSGHACASGASMSMFRTFFHRDDIAFSAFSEASGTTRHFTGFSQALTEVINARVWGGIHFRSADIDGARIGAQVTDFVARHAFRPMRR